MANLRELFQRFVSGTGAPEVPVANPPVKLDIDDPDEVINIAPAELKLPAVISQLLLLSYTDARGRSSVRRVTVRRVTYKNGEAWLGCYCHERKAHRTFRVDRIVELVDLESGEVIEDTVEMFKALAGDETALPDPVRIHAVGIMRSQARLINLLVYFARADGRFSAVERHLIVEFLSALGNAPSPDEKAILDQLIARVFPDDEDFETSLNWLDDMQRDDARAIIELVEHLIKVDGKIHPDEADLLEDLVMVVDDWDH